MTAKMGQPILLRLGAVNQKLVWANRDVMNGQSKGRAENRKLWRITNNNMKAFGGRIQGAFVQDRRRQVRKRK